MIGFETAMGTVEISQEYFANLVGRAASECYGVAGMMGSAVQGLKSVVSKHEAPDKGVRVRTQDGKLVVDLHITVTYGVNISAIVKSIVSKVSYTVQEATGIPVAKVNVHVQGVFTE